MSAIAAIFEQMEKGRVSPDELKSLLSETQAKVARLEAKREWKDPASASRSILCESLVVLAALCCAGGDTASSVRHAERSIALGKGEAGIDPPTETHVQALLHLGNLLALSDPPEAVGVLRRAEAMLVGGTAAAAAAAAAVVRSKQIQDPERKLAVARTSLGVAFAHISQPEEALKVATLARAYWASRAKSAPPAAEFKAEDAYVSALIGLGRLPEALAACDAVLARSAKFPANPAQNFASMLERKRTHIKSLGVSGGGSGGGGSGGGAGAEEAVAGARRDLEKNLSLYKKSGGRDISILLNLAKAHETLALTLTAARMGDVRETLQHLDAFDALQRDLKGLSGGVFDSPPYALKRCMARVACFESMGKDTKALEREMAEIMASPGMVICSADGCLAPSKADGSTMDRCARCLKVYYCSTACQTRDWRERHKGVCKAPGAAAAAAAVAGKAPATAAATAAPLPSPAGEKDPSTGASSAGASSEGGGGGGGAAVTKDGKGGAGGPPPPASGGGAM